MGPQARRVVLPLAVFVGLVLAWEGAVVVLRVQPIVLPPPSGVALTMARTAGPIAFHAWHTLVTLSGPERASWLAWTWGPTLVLRTVGRTSRP